MPGAAAHIDALLAQLLVERMPVGHNAMVLRERLVAILLGAEIRRP